MSKFKEIVHSRGNQAKLYDVPATIPGIQFKGVFTDATKQEIAVAWPVDRPKEAQDEFSKNICMGGEPVLEFQYKSQGAPLKLVTGDNHEELDS